MNLLLPITNFRLMFFVLFIAFYCAPALSQFRIIDVDPTVVQLEQAKRPFPTEFVTMEYDRAFFTSVHNTDLIDIKIPLRDGKLTHFTLESNPIMPPKLAQKFPTFKTFVGHNDAGSTIFADITNKGFHAVIRTPQETFYIDPIGDVAHNQYISYSTADYTKSNDPIDMFQCEIENTPVMDQVVSDLEVQNPSIQFRGGDPVVRRTYVLALATTVEYCRYHGGTKSDAMSAMITAINRVNSVFNTEMAVNIVMHEDTDEVIFCDSDSYTNGDTRELIEENGSIIRARISSLTYDFGHVFCTNAGGLAQLESICTSQKERGVTCHSNPINDPFYIGYVCHEMGHQFGGNHIFNALQGPCQTNINTGTAYEPGSGSTIMAYSGICGGDNVQSNSDPYYNSHSLSELHSFINNGSQGDACATRVTSTNTPPTIPQLYQEDMYLPISTPIELIGSATDMEDENLTYTWEQHDLGPQANLGFPFNGLGPLFRSWPPSDDPTRIIPRVTDLIRNRSSIIEVLPTVTRGLNFRFTTRDNNADAGGVAWVDVEFRVTDGAGPFQVSKYNETGNELIGGDRIELTWDVANTNSAPVNCRYVDIYYSTDGGRTFPFLIAERVSNSGQEFIHVPNITSDLVRFKIKASNNIFFDINNEDISIIERDIPGFAIDFSPRSQKICSPQEANFNISTSAFLGYDQPIDYQLISELPEGISMNGEGQVTPGQSTNLAIHIGPFVSSQILDLEFEITADGSTASSRHILLEIQSNDFRDQSLDTPADGLSNANKSQIYYWTPSTNADSYNFELSDDPLFTNLIHTQSDITEDELDISNLELSEATTYYWRIQPVNECNLGTYSSVSSFRTGISICSDYVSLGKPTTISGGSPVTVTRELLIEDQFTIDDINVSGLIGNHGNVGHLSFVLISPQGTRSRLFSRVCNNAILFDLRLDDDVLSPISCPIDDNGVYLPAEPLSTFIGETAQGTWILEIDDAQQGHGGRVTTWNLEFCAAMDIPSPELVRNNVLIIDELETKSVDNNLLEVSDQSANASDLIYTLIDLPDYGELLLQGVVLELGDNFTQANINNGSLNYRHTAGHAEDDFFKFEVVNPTGGWLGGINFRVDVNEVVHTTVLAEEINIKINPNPASDYFLIHIPSDLNGEIDLTIFDMTGKLIQLEKNIIPGSEKRVKTNNWPSGIYSLIFISKEIRAVKKMVITN